MRIAVITPTYGRPEKFSNMLRSFNENTTENAFVLADLIASDCKHEDYLKLDVQKLIRQDNLPTAYRWNDAAFSVDADIYVLGSDDIEFCTPDWDNKLREIFEQTPDGIRCVGFNDGIQHGATPHFAVSKEWIRNLGYFANPIFFHWYVDTWNVTLAKKINRFYYAQEILIKHNTCKISGVIDDTHKRIRKDGWNSRDALIYNNSQRYMEADAMALKSYINEYYR